MKLFKKMVGACCVVLGVATVASCTSKDEGETYTYRTTVAVEPTNFNPHTWETNQDRLISSYAEIGFVEPIYDTVKDDGSYTWAYEMATAIEDYTPNATDAEREKWGIGADETNRMYKISLNPNAKWANGVAINADTYVYSMKQLLNPKMHNYRANNFVSGDSSIVGAKDYYWAGLDEYVTIDKYLEYPTDGKGVYIDVTTIMGMGFGLKPDAVKGSGLEEYVKVGADGEYLYDLYPNVFSGDCRELMTKEKLVQFMSDFAKTKFYSVMKMEFANADEVCNILTKTSALTEEEVAALKDALYVVSVPKTNPELKFEDTVGLYKVDDYTIMYVLNSTYSEFYFKMSMTSIWLVYEELYEAGKQTIENLETTNYGTSINTYMSYGPYKLASYEKGKQIRFERNENWYGYTDGNHEGQYKTDAIVVDVVEQHETVLMGFNQGKYDDVALTSTDMAKYGNSEWLKAVNTTYTWRLSFNTNLEVLKKLEGNSGNNKQVLANTNFRAAFSMSINRQEFVNEAVGAGTPAYYLVNDLYMYDVENNPNSVYRNTPAAKKAVVDLYGIEYGAGKTYATLDEAYDAVSGFDLPKAQELMQKAYKECIANGTYKDGQKISLDLIVTSRSSISPAARKNATVLNAFIKKAIEGTGFEAGGIEIVAKNLSDYYNQMLNGACEMIFSAWGGAVYWPYSTIECYVNDSELSTTIHEGACWSPEATDLTLTLDFDGDGDVEEETMTYNQWGIELNSGKYSQSSFDLRNEILAALEHNVMSLYYTIPLYCDATVSLDSKRLDYITDEYNIMYSFGGLRFLDYRYSDQEWAKYVAGQGGTLNYE